MNITSNSRTEILAVTDFPGDSVIDNHLFVYGILLASFPSTVANIYKCEKYFFYNNTLISYYKSTLEASKL